MSGQAPPLAGNEGGQGQRNDLWTPWPGDFMAGYLSGLLAGIERGRELAETEAAALHHRAFRVVQQMATLPAHAEVEKRRRTYVRPAWATDEPWPEEMA